MTLLLVGMVAPAVAQQQSRNPFVPNSAASAAAAAAPSESARKPSSSAMPRLPSTSPGIYKSAAPFIPPPPASLPLPTLQLPPAGPDTPTDAGLPPAKMPAADPGPATPSVKEEHKSDVFMTREQLKTERAKCSVALKTPADLKFSENGGKQVVRLTIVGGRQCVKGVAASFDWVEVSSVSDGGELVLNVQENEGAEERDAEVNIANTGTSLTVRVHQSANKAEFREVKL